MNQSIKADPVEMDILKWLCRDMDIRATQIEPHHLKLQRGPKTMRLMTISLTTYIDGKWSYTNTIQKAREQILQHFK